MSFLPHDRSISFGHKSKLVQRLDRTKIKRIILDVVVKKETCNLPLFDIRLYRAVTRRHFRIILSLLDHRRVTSSS